MSRETPQWRMKEGGGARLQTRDVGNRARVLKPIEYSSLLLQTKAMKHTGPVSSRTKASYLEAAR